MLLRRRRLQAAFNLGWTAHREWKVRWMLATPSPDLRRKGRKRLRFPLDGLQRVADQKFLASYTTEKKSKVALKTESPKSDPKT
jgi:hypothetical protein